MERLAVGVVRTSHGVHGHVKVRSFSGETAHLMSIVQVRLRKDNREKDYTVEEWRALGDGVLLKLQGIDTPEKAKELAGYEIWAPRESAAPLQEGEYYTADLHGCDLYAAGEKVGTVTGMTDSGLYDLLIVQTDRGERLVPFDGRFIGRVDPAEGYIELLERELVE
jgi:16S rRNA processing protein RimM